jgi:hypothetical protein
VSDILGHYAGGFKVFLDKLRRLGLEVYSRYYSDYPARVVDVDDPEGLGRVRFNCPMLNLDAGADHPRFASPKFGPIAPGDGYGSMWVPDVGDQIWVSFRNGDPNDPVYTPAGYWQKGQVPTDLFETTKDRGFRTRAGHSVRARDTEGEESLLIQHANGSKIELDEEDRIVLETNGGDTIVIDPGGDLTLAHRKGTSLTLTDASALLKTPGGSTIEIDETSAKHSARLTTEIESARIALKGKTVSLGKGAASPALKGDVTFTYLLAMFTHALTHTHICTAPGSPSGPGLPPPPKPPSSMLSRVVKVK